MIGLTVALGAAVSFVTSLVLAAPPAVPSRPVRSTDA
jgi:hypothetical protein